MKTKTMFALSAVLLGTAFAANAGNWSVSIGVGVPVYYPPAPVIVASAPCLPPPPVVYCPPPQVVCSMPAVRYQPARFVPPGHMKKQYKHWKHGDHWGRHDDRRGYDRHGHR